MELGVSDGVWPVNIHNSPEAAVLEDFQLLPYGLGHLPRFCSIQECAKNVVHVDANLGLCVDNPERGKGLAGLGELRANLNLKLRNLRNL